ncbi:hypothetical protein H5410_061773 [Solanum commersonii]|uniref:Uncharacterized protein n=1 Tax=Solanum commersonii TaxID=4109 RepID=A0A9J5W9L5_SOLCO|nr:hypothetical protein H5410_061773 [Solanum commersonii]
MPWIVGGDFNTIIHVSEKLGGLVVTQNETTNFIGSYFTWWNGIIDEECIFKRRDNSFENNEFMNTLQESEVHHLIRKGSDHAPLHVSCNNIQEQINKSFRFLNFWANHNEFVRVVEESWKKEAQGSPFTIVQQNIKRLKEEYSKHKARMRWFQNGDRNTKFFHAYGDIISSTHNIGEETVNLFREQFTETNEPTYYTMLENILKIISREKN